MSVPVCNTWILKSPSIITYIGKFPEAVAPTSSTFQWRIQDFPEVGAPTIQGALTYDFAKFSQKLHEI